MWEYLVGVIQGHSIQPHSILLNQSPTLTLTDRKLPLDQHIEHGLSGMQVEGWYIFR
jgi:hypothetical protein